MPLIPLGGKGTINEEDFDSNRPAELQEPTAIVEREGFKLVVVSTWLERPREYLASKSTRAPPERRSAQKNLTLWLLADETPKTVFWSNPRVHVIVQGFTSKRASGCLVVVADSKIVSGDGPKAARGFLGRKQQKTYWVNL